MTTWVWNAEEDIEEKYILLMVEDDEGKVYGVGFNGHIPDEDTIRANLHIAKEKRYPQQLWTMFA